MKKYTTFFLIFALILSMAGCRTTVPGNSDPSASQTPSTNQSVPSGQTQANSAQEILTAIWNKYPASERFSVYGGMVNNSVDNAPGNLDLTFKDEIMSKYLIPEDRLSQVQEGASLVHLMNSNLFTAAVFRLNAGVSAQDFAKAVREALQKNRWLCGQPDKLLITQPQSDYVLISFGSEDVMNSFTTYSQQAFPQSTTFHSEAIVA